MSEYSNIDDVLAGASAPTPAPEPEAPQADIQTESENVEPDYQEPEREDELEGYDIPEAAEGDDGEDAPEDAPELDDYGNEKAKPKMYSENEVNERINKAIRERLARMERNNQPTQQQIQQDVQQGYQYDENSSEDWQTQLANFIDNRLTQREQQVQQKQIQEREKRAQEEFEDKMFTGMNKFSDFRDVVGTQPFSDAMVYATRSLEDPAAFMYAASKRHAQELQRISRLTDPIAQVTEIGRLEERMRKAKAGTKAPKPVSHTPSEKSMPAKAKKKETTIEDLLHASENKRRQAFNQRRGNR